MAGIKKLLLKDTLFQDIIFQWQRIFEKPLAFCEFSLDFQSENGFELTKDSIIEMGGSFWFRTYFCFFRCLTPPPIISLGAGRKKGGLYLSQKGASTIPLDILQI